MIIGPFIITFDDSHIYDVNVAGLNKLDIYPDTEDVRLMRLMLDPEPSDNRSLNGFNLNIEWSLNLLTNKQGISSFEIEFARVWGTLKIEDLPIGADPYDDDVELEEYEYKIDSDITKMHLEVSTDFRNFKIRDELYPSRLYIDFNTKIPHVELGIDY